MSRKKKIWGFDFLRKDGEKVAFFFLFSFVIFYFINSLLLFEINTVSRSLGKIFKS